MTDECLTARGGSGTVMGDVLAVSTFAAPAAVAVPALGVAVPAASRALMALPPPRAVIRVGPGCRSARRSTAVGGHSASR